MQPKGEELAIKPILLRAAHINELLNLDSSPQNLKNFIVNYRSAQLKDSNLVEYFLELNSLSVGVENAVAKI